MPAQGNGPAGVTSTDDAVTALFGQPTGAASSWTAGQAPAPLGLTVLRYNVGGSPTAPTSSCDPAWFRPGGAVPVLTASAGAPVDLGRDQAQVAVLGEAVSTITASGVQPRVQLFSNSPPYWMMSDECSGGSGHFSAQPADFAQYLQAVTVAFEQSGVPVQSVEPFNETDNNRSCAQGDTGCQEFAKFDVGEIARVVSTLCAELPAGVRVAATDAQYPVDFLHVDWQTLSDPAQVAPGCLGQVDVHSYSDSGHPVSAPVDESLRSAVSSYAANLATSAPAQAPPGVPLWMSEYGTGGTGSDGSGTALAAHIADDLNYLGPQAWVYWTGMESRSGWGLLADRNEDNQDNGTPATFSQDTLVPTYRYFALGQYSTSIRPGATLYPITTPAASGDVRAVVAKNTDGSVAVVATNPSDSAPQRLQLNLRGLGITDQLPARVQRVDTGSTATGPIPTIENAQAPATERVQAGILSDRLPADTVTTYRFPSGLPTPGPSPASTTLTTYNPWQRNAAGTEQPAPGLATTNATGSCDSGSADDPGRAAAWRCTGGSVGNGTPCFARTESGDPGSSLLCVADPTSNSAVLLNQGGGQLPLNIANPDNPSQPPWVLVLADGRTCHLLGYGTNTAGAPYDCGGGLSATLPDRSTPVWTVREGVGSAASGSPVNVRTAYR